jgi:hypothetical protein
MEAIFGLTIVLRSEIKPWIMLGWVKLRNLFGNGEFARLTERLMEVLNVQCRSFDINTELRCRSFNASIECSMVIDNDHFSLRIVFRTF